MMLCLIEIISLIFTIGSDDNADGSIYESIYSSPRHIKPYIGLVAQLCRRWNTITRWKANAHFWITELSLRLTPDGLNNDAMSQYCHRVRTVSKFRHAL